MRPPRRQGATAPPRVADGTGLRDTETGYIRPGLSACPRSRRPRDTPARFAAARTARTAASISMRFLSRLASRYSYAFSFPPQLNAEAIIITAAARAARAASQPPAEAQAAAGYVAPVSPRLPGIARANAPLIQPSIPSRVSVRRPVPLPSAPPRRAWRGVPRIRLGPHRERPCPAFRAPAARPHQAPPSHPRGRTDQPRAGPALGARRIIRAPVMASASFGLFTKLATKAAKRSGSKSVCC